MKFLRIKSISDIPSQSMNTSLSIDRIPDASSASSGSAPFDHEVSSSDDDLLNFTPHGDAIMARKKKLEERAIMMARTEANREALKHKESRKLLFSVSHIVTY